MGKKWQRKMKYPSKYIVLSVVITAGKPPSKWAEKRRKMGRKKKQGK